MNEKKLNKSKTAFKTSFRTLSKVAEQAEIYHAPEQTKVRLINVFINIYLTYIIALNVCYTFIVKLYV